MDILVGVLVLFGWMEGREPSEGGWWVLRLPSLSLKPKLTGYQGRVGVRGKPLEVPLIHDVIPYR